MPRTDRTGGKPAYYPTWRNYANEPPLEQIAATRRQVLDDRKDRFASINELAIKAGDAWLVSIPGDIEVRVEALPSSTFPDRLRDLGYRLMAEPDGERILACAITERFGRAADGTLVPITEGSTLPVVHRVAHAGIVGVQRYSFLL
jgi:hypothetical protein